MVLVIVTVVVVVEVRSNGGSSGGNSSSSGSSIDKYLTNDKQSITVFSNCIQASKLGVLTGHFTFNYMGKTSTF